MQTQQICAAVPAGSSTDLSDREFKREFMHLICEYADTLLANSRDMLPAARLRYIAEGVEDMEACLHRLHPEFAEATGRVLRTELCLRSRTLH